MVFWNLCKSGFEKEYDFGVVDFGVVITGDLMDDKTREPSMGTGDLINDESIKPSLMIVNLMDDEEREPSIILSSP